jgi:hypothetical protein
MTLQMMMALHGTSNDDGTSSKGASSDGTSNDGTSDEAAWAEMGFG